MVDEFSYDDSMAHVDFDDDERDLRDALAYRAAMMEGVERAAAIVLHRLVDEGWLAPDETHDVDRWAGEIALAWDNGE